MKHKLLLLYTWFVRISLFIFPDLPLIMRFRGWLYGLGMNKCGKNFQVAHNVIFNTLEEISIGNDTYFAPSNIILANGKIEIGDEVIFGPNCVLVSSEHDFDGKSYRNMSSRKIDIIVGNGVWVAANVSIVGGANIPDRSLVAAGAVMNRTSGNEEDALYAGVPGKFKKKLR